jgi:hypothetical protein
MEMAHDKALDTVEICKLVMGRGVKSRIGLETFRVRGRPHGASFVALGSRDFKELYIGDRQAY